MADDSELQRALGRVEGKLDQALSAFAEQAKSHSTQFAALDRRVGSVEKKVWWFSGFAALAGYIAQNIMGKH